MYVTRDGQSISSVVRGRGPCGSPRVLTTRAQRRLLALRGLGTSTGTATPPALMLPFAHSGRMNMPINANLNQSDSNYFGTTAIGPILEPGGPFSLNPILPPPGTTAGTPGPTGTGITQTVPTSPAIPGSPVPQGYPTTELFTDSSGNVWQFQTSSGQWVKISTTTAASPTGFIANTPVPVGTPTDTPFVDSTGNIWTYSSAAGTWIEQSVVGSSSGAGGFYAGTPVPIGYPTNQAYVDAYGNTWTYSSVSGTWVESSAYYSALTAATSGSANPGGGSSSSTTIQQAPASETQSLLDWFSEQTLISGIPNWMIAAVAGFAALKITQRGKR